MDALVAELSADPTRSRRWILGGAVGAALFLGGGYLIAQTEAELRDPCAELGDEIGELWNDERRAAVRGAILSTELGYAQAAWDRLEPRLDGYAEAWSERRLEACRSHESGAHDADLYGLEVRCLERRRSALRLLLGRLDDADAGVLRRAIQAAEELPAVATCADVGVLTSEVAPPEDAEVAAEVERLREVLAEARLEHGLRRHAAGLLLSTPVVERSRELDHPPLEAEALQVHGLLLEIAGEYEAAEETLTRGVWRADLIGDDDVLAETMASLVYVIGEGRGEYHRAASWRAHADTVIERLGEGTGGEARLLAIFGQLMMRMSEGDEALALSRRSLEIVEALHGADDRRCIGALIALGNAHAGRGSLGEAQALYERALRINEAELGPDHPALATILNNIATVRGMSGDVDGALPLFERALRIEEAVLGPDHPSLAERLGNIGATYALQGELERARGYLERALAIDTQARGSDHPQVAVTLHNLGSVHLRLGDDESGRRCLERSLAIREAKLGKSAPMTIAVMSDLGETNYRAGRTRSGLRYLERAYGRASAHPEGLSARANAGMRLAAIHRELPGRKARAKAQRYAAEALAAYTELGDEANDEAVVELQSWLDELAASAPAPRKKKKKKKKKKKRKKQTKR